MVALSSSTRPDEINFPVSVQALPFHVTKPDTRGYNSLYEYRRARSYLFQLEGPRSTGLKNSLFLYTNDNSVKTSPVYYYNSSSPYLNKKFRISLLLTTFFKLQTVIPRSVQRKYFSYLRDKLLERITIIETRSTSQSNNNRCTNTFFNFSYKKFRFHLGIFVPCPYCVCPVPVPVVFSRDRRSCCKHRGILERSTFNHPTPPVNSKKSAYLKVYNSWKNEDVKHVYNKRLGISYDTSYDTYPDPSVKIRTVSTYVNFHHGISFDVPDTIDLVDPLLAPYAAKSNRHYVFQKHYYNYKEDFKSPSLPDTRQSLGTAPSRPRTKKIINKDQFSFTKRTKAKQALRRSRHLRLIHSVQSKRGFLPQDMVIPPDTPEEDVDFIFSRIKDDSTISTKYKFLTRRASAFYRKVPHVLYEESLLSSSSVGEDHPTRFLRKIGVLPPPPPPGPTPEELATRYINSLKDQFVNALTTLNRSFNHNVHSAIKQDGQLRALANRRVQKDYRLTSSSKTRVSQDSFAAFHTLAVHKRLAKLSFCADSNSISTLLDLHKTFNTILNNRKHSGYSLLAPFAGSMARKNPSTRSGFAERSSKAKARNQHSNNDNRTSNRVLKFSLPTIFKPLARSCSQDGSALANKKRKICDNNSSFSESYSTFMINSLSDISNAHHYKFSTMAHAHKPKNKKHHTRFVEDQLFIILTSPLVSFSGNFSDYRPPKPDSSLFPSINNLKRLVAINDDLATRPPPKKGRPILY